MIALYNIYLLACTLFVFASSENVSTWQYPTRSVTVAFPGAYCGQEFLIEGAVLTSSRDILSRYDQCTLRFSPMASYKERKLMMKFTHYNVTDCGVTLNIYNLPDSNGSPNIVLGCKNPPTPTFLFGGQHLTLQLSKRTVTGYDFRIVITAFSDYVQRSTRRPMCDAFLCGNAHPTIAMCIESSLLCDGVANCFDELDSDETKGCDANATFVGGSKINTGSSWWVAGTVIFFLIVIASFGHFIYKRVRRRQLSSQNRAALVSGQVEQSGLLVGHTSSGNVITLQQPIHIPDGQHPEQLPPLTSPGQPPHPEQPYYPVSQPPYPVQAFSDAPGVQQPAPTYPGQPSFYPQQPYPQPSYPEQSKNPDI